MQLGVLLGIRLGHFGGKCDLHGDGLEVWLADHCGEPAINGLGRLVEFWVHHLFIQHGQIAGRVA